MPPTRRPLENLNLHEDEISVSVVLNERVPLQQQADQFTPSGTDSGVPGQEIISDYSDQHNPFCTDDGRSDDDDDQQSVSFIRSEDGEI